MSTLYRARVVRIDGTDVFVEVPDLGGGNEWGPIEMAPVVLAVGDSVLVGSINDVMDDLALVAKLVTVAVPSAPANLIQAYAYADQAARDAAGLTPTDGMMTWLDAERRLDIRSSALNAWLSVYAAYNNQLILPQAHRIGVGNTNPVAGIDMSAAATTDRLAGAGLLGDPVGRFVVQADGAMFWGGGAVTRDVVLQRDAAGRMSITNQLTVGGSSVSTTTVGAKQTTDRTGFFSTNTAGGTHTNPHIFASDTGSATSRLLESYALSDAAPRFRVLMNGTITWGPGVSTSPDTNLYRNAAGVLKTDGDLVVGGKFSRHGILVDFGTPSIANSSVTTLTPASASPNNYGMWTSGTDIVIQRAGEYEIGGVLRFASQTTTVGIRQFRILVNGADEMLWPHPTTTQQNSTNTVAFGTTHKVLAVNDVVTFATFHNAGAALSLVTGSRGWVRLVEG